MPSASMWIAACLVSASACSWSSAITQMRPTPDPGGPCLQITHAGPHRWDLYRGDARLGPNDRATYTAAFVDAPASAALLASGGDLERRAAILGGGGMALGVAAGALGAALGAPALELAGGGLMAAAFVTAGALALVADRRWGEAVADYNAAAARRGCPVAAR